MTSFGRACRAFFAAITVVTALCACDGADPGDLPDAGPDARADAGAEASVKDVVVPDVRDVMVTPADARPDTPWCGENPFPGVDPNAQELTSAPATEITPNFSWDGTRIAYSRDTLAPSEPGVDYEVFLFDMDSWLEIQITNQAGSNQVSPYVHGDQIVWADARFSTPVENYRSELMAYDLAVSSETRLTDSPDMKATPRYNGRYVAYDLTAEGTSYRAFHLLDLVTSEATELSAAGQAHEGTSISDRYVTWVAYPPNTQFTDKDVFIHDLQTGQTQHLASTSGAATFSTSVWGSKVVWEDFRNGQWDIYLYDIETDQEVRLTDDPFDQTGPRIHGNLVTFSDYRFTLGYFYGYCARDIYILDIDTMIGRRVTTLPWHWFGQPGDNGWLLAVLLDEPAAWAPAKLYLFDLIAMGILDPTGQHVLPAP